MYGRGHILRVSVTERDPKTNFCHNGIASETGRVLAQNKLRKLRVFNAVVTSKVLYGLETLEPTCSAGNLLDTFQLKGLRKNLRLHTTFVRGAKRNRA